MQEDENNLKVPDQAFLRRELSKISEENSVVGGDEHPNGGHLFQTEYKYIDQDKEDGFANLEEEIGDGAQERPKTVRPKLETSVLVEKPEGVSNQAEADLRADYAINLTNA
jgi:hypothetical protein